MKRTIAPRTSEIITVNNEAIISSPDVTIFSIISGFPFITIVSVSGIFAPPANALMIV